MRARKGGETTGQGDSSMIFWCRRWIEQSRSPRCTNVSLFVAEHLNLDMARADQGALQQQPSFAERADGLGARGVQGGLEFVDLMDHAHAAPAAAGARFDHQGKTDALRLVGETARGSGPAVIARRAGHAGLDHSQFGRALVAHGAHRGRRRADKDQTGVGAGLREVGIFGEETIAGMDGLRARRFRGGDNEVASEIGLRGRRGADPDGGVGEAHMRGVRVGVAVDGDGPKAFRARGAKHAARDLAAIGDQQRGKSRSHQLRSAHFGARLLGKSRDAFAPLRPAQASGESLAASRM